MAIGAIASTTMLGDTTGAIISTTAIFLFGIKVLAERYLT